MVDQNKIREAVKMIIEAIGEDSAREGLVDTPDRVARMYAEIFSGLGEDPKIHMRTFFNIEHDEMVLVKDISFFSMCEHHFLPFFGKVSVAYIPKNGRVTGLSKLARIVDCIARRPQLQERLTSSIAARYPLDRFGVGRKASEDGPDIGAYEYVAEPEKETR